MFLSEVTMSFSSRLRGYFQHWLYGKKKQPLRKRPKKTRLLIEMLEDRTVMSALPAAVVGPTALALAPTIPTAQNSSTPFNTSPTLAIDPLNPNNLVEVHTTFNSKANPPFWSLEGDYTTDRGQTWSPFIVAFPTADPA